MVQEKTPEKRIWHRMPRPFWRHTRNERGATMVEYALIIGLAAAAIAGGIGVLANGTLRAFSITGNAVANARDGVIVEDTGSDTEDEDAGTSGEIPEGGSP